MSKPVDHQRPMSNSRKQTVRLVETHLSKQRTAYDTWISELCRDAEESAQQRDALKAKLDSLRQDQKRKLMLKILGRLANMQYFRAWSCWYNVTVKMHQMDVEAQIRALETELGEIRAKAVALEDEGQRRADEAARLAFGSVSSAQRSLVLKIMTKMITGFTRIAWRVWYVQAFKAKLQKQLMVKILKRLYHAALSKGWVQWKMIASKWSLVLKLELRERLLAELAQLERQAAEFKEDAERRQDEATSAAIARASGAQRDLLVKILTKMCGNLLMSAYNIWEHKWRVYNYNFKLLTKVLTRLVNIKAHSAIRHWYTVCISLAKDKHAAREMLLESQRDNLKQTLKQRAAELLKLQAEAEDLLKLSQQNAANTASVMAVSDQFADSLHLLLDPKALDKRDAPDLEQLFGDDDKPRPA